jgi:hypothetical protein
MCGILSEEPLPPAFPAFRRPLLNENENPLQKPSNPPKQLLNRNDVNPAQII